MDVGKGIVNYTDMQFVMDTVEFAIIGNTNETYK